MPVYLVTGVELAGGQRQFEYLSDVPLEKNMSLQNRPFENAPLRFYLVRRVGPDPSGRYDGLVDADQWAASGLDP